MAGDTIYSLATAPGKSGLAVVRVSGPVARAGAERLAGRLPPPRRMGVRRLRNLDGDAIDEALIVAFDAGASFTGEEVVEFHVHGSRAVVAALLAALGLLPDHRHADPGEFTRRALANGRMDLTQVEGLGDLIEAETGAQLRLAQRTLDGAVGRKTETWRARLVELTGLLEATIDFSDEEIPPDLVPEVRAGIAGLAGEWVAEIAGVAAAERVRDGFEVAVVGPPNAGKSTLINAIARRDVAITSTVAGTTRDVIEVRLDLRGLPVTLLDTAGLREASDEVEAIGVGRTLDRLVAADLRVFLSAPDETLAALRKDGDIVAHGKADLRRGPGLNVSGATGDGVATLLDAIAAELAGRAASPITATRRRHADALRAGTEALQRAGDALLRPGAEELAAAELRHALHAMDVLVGRVDVEDILGHIFAAFCIGK